MTSTMELPVAAEAIPALREKAMPHGVELRHLRYFVAVVEAGTFTQATERMFITQPTLSQQIRRLEEMVGRPLLQRHREGVRLTAAGSVLLEESRTVLSLIEHGVDQTRQVAGRGGPRLQMAIPPDIPGAVAAAAASRLQGTAARAGVEVTWLEIFADAQFSLVREHQAEFTNPPFRQALPTLAFAATASRPTAVLTGPRHRAGTLDATEAGQAADAYDMVPRPLDQSPLTASAGLVWSGDLPRPLQQVLFDTADDIEVFSATMKPAFTA